MLRVAKFQDLFEHFEDGGKSAVLPDFKVICLLLNADIKKKTLKDKVVVIQCSFRILKQQV